MFCCKKFRGPSYSVNESREGSPNISEDKASLRNGNLTISAPIPLKNGASADGPDSVYENQNQVSNTNLEQLAELNVKPSVIEQCKNISQSDTSKTQSESKVTSAADSSDVVLSDGENDADKYENIVTQTETLNKKRNLTKDSHPSPSTSIPVETGSEIKNKTTESCDAPTSVYENVVPGNKDPRESILNSPPPPPTETKSSLLQTANQVPESETELTNQLESARQEVANTLQEVENLELDEMSQEIVKHLIDRLETVATRLEVLSENVGLGSGKGGAAQPVESSPSVMAFDELVNGPLAKFISLSESKDAGVKEMVNLVSQAFRAQRDILATASQTQKPSTDVMIQIFKPLNDKVTEVQAYREANRAKRDIENHLATLSESISALGWVGVSPTPAPFIKEMKDSGVFYSNRILKEFKEKDASQVEWVKAWNQTLQDLHDYVKQHHTTGLTWNPKGSPASAGSAPAPPPPAGVPPPPPPGGIPPPPPPGAPAPSTGSTKPDTSALFSEINKGSDISKGLKKVTDDMKTHKNPALRQGPAPFKPHVTPKPISAPVVSKPQTNHPPVTKLEDKKWIVEYHTNNKDILIEKTQLRETVYIYKCVGSTIQIKGKVNSVIMDSCKKCGVVFDDILSSVEFVNCQSVQGQVIGRVPTISIDKTDGCMVYLSKDSLDSEIVTAKSSEMNILVPTGDGDMKEFALPEQFKTSWNGKSFTTTMTESI